MADKIIRTATQAKGGITDKEKQQLDDHAKLWIERIMRTDPIEKDKIVPAIKDLYKVSGLKEPRVVIVPSPLVASIANGLSASIWYLRKNTRTATDAVTDAATDAKQHWLKLLVEKLTPNKLEFSLGCIRLSYKMRQGGNMWGQYDSYLSAYRDVLNLKGLDIWGKYAPWEQATIHGGYRYMHEEYCIVSDFPKTLKVDDQNRPHCETGPSHEWRDGFKLFHLQGVKFEEEVWQKIVDGTYTIEDHMALKNADARAVALDMLRERNPNFILDTMNAKIIHTGIKGTKLYKVDNFMDTGVTEYCMVMKHPTLDRTYLEWVARETGEKGDADLAQCDAWQDAEGTPIPLEDYLLAVEA